MGQMTYALIYGVEEDDFERWTGPDGEGGIIKAYRRHCMPAIKALAKKVGRDAWYLEDRFVPDHPHGDADLRVYGFWIAVGASGMDDIPDLESVQLSPSAVREKYAESYKKARRRWLQFARYCVGQNFELPKPRIWLAQTEVA